MPFRWSGIIGVTALVVAVWVGLPVKQHRYVCPEHFSNPVVALEFVRSETELRTLFSGEALDTGILAVRQTQLRDTVFICAYTLFLGLFSLALYRVTGKKRYNLLLALALLIGLADIFENGSIARLLQFLESGGTLDEVDFRRLHLFTWIKWAGLALFFASAAPFLRRAGRLGQLLAIGGLLVAVLCAAALLWRSHIQTFTSSVFLIFPLAIVFCFVYRKEFTNSGT